MAGKNNCSARGELPFPLRAGGAVPSHALPSLIARLRAPSPVPTHFSPLYCTLKNQREEQNLPDEQRGGISNELEYNSAQEKSIPFKSLISTIWKLILTAQVIKCLLLHHRPLVSTMAVRPGCAPAMVLQL